MFLTRVEISPKQMLVDVNTDELRAVLVNGDTDADIHCSPSTIKQIAVEHQIRKRGVEAKLMLTDRAIRQTNLDQVLIKLVAKAQLWRHDLTSGAAKFNGSLAQQHSEDPTEISRFLPLAFPALDINESILAGTQPVDLTIEKLRRLSNIPIAWAKQRAVLGITN